MLQKFLFDVKHTECVECNKVRDNKIADMRK